MNIIEAISLGLFGALAWYIPLRMYSQRTIAQRAINETRWSPMLMSYTVWYVPVLILIVGATLGDLADSGAICWSAMIVAALWAFIGHNWVKSYPLKVISQSNEE